MNGPRIATCVLLLLLLFFAILVNEVASVQGVQGWDYGNGEASVLHACDAGRGNVQPTWSYELNYVQWATNDIVNHAFAGASRYAWYYFPEYQYGYYYRVGPTYGHLLNYVQDYESATTRTNVLDGITDCESHHEFSTFLYVGHYSIDGSHYGFCGHGKGKEIGDSSIDRIYDYDIDGRISWSSNHHFVFLWVCSNANPDSAMPYAWTSRSLNPDGYWYADGTTYCLTGFQGASPMLCKELNGANNLHKHWLVFFYYYAGWQQGYSINGALDKASQAVGYPDFAGSRLYQPWGFSAWWPGFEDPTKTPVAGWYTGRMRVYGDGSVHVPGTVYTGGGPWG